MNILVMAAAGRRVRLPSGQVLDDTMEATEADRRDLFIARRLAEGDLVEVPPAPEPAAPAAAGPAKEKTR